MTPELEKRLQGHMSDEAWAKFKPLCDEFGVSMDDESLEYGSMFITVKVWFDMGFDYGKEKK